MYKILNLSKDTLLAEEAELADTFFSRMKGLLFRQSLAKSCALIIKPTSSIHTFFMRFPIDIVFLDKDNSVLKARHRVPPFRLIACPLAAKSTIEFPAGTLESSRTQPGDTLVIKK